MRAILTYHSLDDSGSVISTSPDAFRRHVGWLASGAVRVTGIDELMKLPGDANAVALTFDDGFANFNRVALPLLRDHGLPATVFVVTEHVGGANNWGGVAEPGIPELPLLDWDDLALAAQAGMTLGAHTRRHPHMSTLDDSRLQDEVAGSAAAIETHTGRAPLCFAYPYGDVNERAAHAVARTFRWGCTTELRTLRGVEHRARLPRLDMYYLRDAGRLERWGSLRFDQYLKLRGKARRLKQLIATLR